MKSRTGFDVGGFVVSAGGTDQKVVSAGIDNGIDSEGGTVSDMVT